MKKHLRILTGFMIFSVAVAQADVNKPSLLDRVKQWPFAKKISAVGALIIAVAISGYRLSKKKAPARKDAASDERCVLTPVTNEVSRTSCTATSLPTEEKKEALALANNQSDGNAHAAFSSQADTSQHQYLDELPTAGGSPVASDSRSESSDTYISQTPSDSTGAPTRGATMSDDISDNTVGVRRRRNRSEKMYSAALSAPLPASKSVATSSQPLDTTPTCGWFPSFLCGKKPPRQRGLVRNI